MLRSPRSWLFLAAACFASVSCRSSGLSSTAEAAPPPAVELQLVFHPANARTVGTLRSVVALAESREGLEPLSLEFVDPAGKVVAQSTLEVDTGTPHAELSLTLPAGGSAQLVALAGTWSVRAVSGHSKRERQFELTQ